MSKQPLDKVYGFKDKIYHVGTIDYPDELLTIIEDKPSVVEKEQPKQTKRASSSP